MSTINMGRAILGGLLAGLVINISEFVLNMFVFGAQMEAAMRSLNLPPIGPNKILAFVVLGFALGIVTVWLYAAVRPRFGAGPSTAACAGLIVWFLAYAYPNAGMMVIHLFSRKMLAIGTVWGLFEIVIAAVVGAWVYKEA